MNLRSSKRRTRFPIREVGGKEKERAFTDFGVWHFGFYSPRIVFSGICACLASDHFVPFRLQSGY